MRHRTVPRLVLLLAASLLPVIGGSMSASADWLTYHADLARSGANPSVPAMTNAITQRWAYPGLDGSAYAEPLVYGRMVIAATENNSVYAIDAGTGNLLWSKNYGRPVPNSQLPCGNVDPVGITSTPVIDAATGTLFAVGFMWDGSNSASIHYQLEAINLNNAGAELWHRTIAPTDPTYVFDPMIEGQRSALSLANGTVYIPFGGRYGDCNSSIANYRSWTVGSATSGTGSLLSFPLPTPNGGGGTWASSGSAMDPSNNLYIATGNTFCSGGCAYDYGESVLKLSSSLSLLDHFAPSDWASLNASDTDLASVGPTLLGNNLLFQVGKAGAGYLLSTTNLGGSNHETPLFSGQVCNATADAAFGGVAYSAPYLYVPCSDHLEALLVTTGATPSFTCDCVWRVLRPELHLYLLDVRSGHNPHRELISRSTLAAALITPGNPSASCCDSDAAACAAPSPRSGESAPG